MDEIYDDENMPFDDEIDENSSFVVVKDINGANRVVRKPTLIWMLCEPSEKLSKDRLKRVQIGQKRRKSN